MLSNRQIAIIIGRRNAAKKAQTPQHPMLAACVAAAGFTEHRAY
jgi:hypothetical protein